ncbi:MAG TPA: SigE family RNA polymerase sigma factor [Streptosporangiaceae bacterium]|jgi:RNA polymerase sigma-70 factor (sigma-E family)
MDDAAEEEFREFVAARSPALMRLAFLLTGGDRPAAEDLLQTALAKTAARWRGIEDPGSYVRRVMYRQQISWWRLSRRHRETSVAAPPDQAGTDHTSALDLKLVVRGVLSQLTPRQRAVLVLRYFEDLPEADVARLLGCRSGRPRLGCPQGWPTGRCAAGSAGGC